ncbi:MAG: hypothetical protein JKY37_01330, partial [Nannocystaceae bacterium]|nr:hypothetical protein [Nannocystaceae bacterium]
MRSWIVGASLALATCGGEPLPGAGSSEDDGTTATAATTSHGGAEGIPSSVADESGESSEGGDESPAGRVPTTCAVVDVPGECRDAALCGPNDATFQAVCRGTPANQCCIPASQPCSHLGAPGLCLNDVLCPETFDLYPGSCPAEGQWRCCSDPLTRCDPTAAPLPNEGLREEVWTDRCPAGMVIVESDGVGADHCIDRYEASVVVLDDDGNVVSSWSPYHNPGETRVAAV